MVSVCSVRGTQVLFRLLVKNSRGPDTALHLGAVSSHSWAEAAFYPERVSKNWFWKILKVSSRSSLCPFFLASGLCQRSAFPSDWTSTQFWGWERGELHNFPSLPQGLCKIPNEDNFSSWSLEKYPVSVPATDTDWMLSKYFSAEMESNGQHRKS